MRELQTHFLGGVLAPFLCEAHCPLDTLKNPRPQKDDISDELIIEDRARERSSWLWHRSLGSRCGRAGQRGVGASGG
jgi:hypothetical protein